MRSKKLSRQLKKVLECEEIDSELPAIQTWIAAQPETAAPPSNIVAIVNNFAAFLDVIDVSYEQNEANLEHAQRSLALGSQEIEERNKLLRAENKKVSDLLNNMRQAVFSVDLEGLIVAPVSRFADAVFGYSLVGKSILNEVYAELDRKSEEYASLRSAMIGVFGEGELQWDLMVEYFPNRAIIYSSGKPREPDHAKFLKVSVNPIWDDGGMLERIMFIVDDVTEVEKLERLMVEEKTKSDKSLRIIQELVAIARAETAEFLRCSREALHDSKKYLDSEHFDLDLVFRNLHTIKGNARGFKFQRISNAAHHVESVVAQCRDHSEPNSWQENQEEVFELLAVLEAEIGAYAHLAETVLGLTAVGANKDQILNRPATISANALVAKLAPLVQNLKPRLNPYELEQFESVFKKADESVVRPGLNHLADVAGNIARELGKILQVEVVDPNDLSMDPKSWRIVQDALMHLVTNSVDHGIETEEQRKKSGKQNPGRIRIECFEKKDQLSFLVTDNGKGLDENTLVARALKTGFIDEAEAQKLTRQEKYHLIFAPGFTTKNEVTEISGRGAGLDAARAQIENLGGHIEIVSELGKGTTFKIVLNLQKSKSNSTAA